MAFQLEYQELLQLSVHFVVSVAVVMHKYYVIKLFGL